MYLLFWSLNVQIYMIIHLKCTVTYEKKKHYIKHEAGVRFSKVNK